MYTEGIVDHVEPSGDIRYSSLSSILTSNPHFSPINPDEWHDDPETRVLYPKFAHAIPGECHLEAGEMLYLPTGWFHYGSYEQNTGFT